MISRVSTPWIQIPRSLLWLGGAFLLLIIGVSLGLHQALDRAVAATLWQDVPCWGRGLGDYASILFAAELSVVYALGLGYVCLRARQPVAASAIVGLLFVGVGLELLFKHYFSHPDPSAFLGTVSRAACGPAGPAYPFTTVSTPSTLPSGYSIRAAYFSLLVAAMIGGRWPSRRVAALVVLGAVALVTAASRITVGWHWPTDVAAGLLLGACFAVLATAVAGDFAWLRSRETGGGALPTPPWGPWNPPTTAHAGRE